MIVSSASLHVRYRNRNKSTICTHTRAYIHKIQIQEVAQRGPLSCSVSETLITAQERENTHAEQSVHTAFHAIGPDSQP